MKTLLCASPFIDGNFFAFYSSVLVRLSHGGFMKAGTKILFPYSIATVQVNDPARLICRAWTVMGIQRHFTEAEIQEFD